MALVAVGDRRECNPARQKLLRAVYEAVMTVNVLEIPATVGGSGRRLQCMQNTQQVVSPTWACGLLAS